MIELRGISKSFTSTIALHPTDLFVQEGEIFGIIGKSGAGKSTLLRCINLLERPDQGDVIVDNQLLNQLSPHALRQARHKVAMIFQHFNLLSSQTVFENIALPMRLQHLPPETIAPKIDELLQLVDLQDKKNAYPQQLSGGQKQRVAIARALSCSPKVLLCDEATSALDPQSTEAILSLLKTINTHYGITIVLITHEMDVVKRICHRLAVMEQGKFIEVDSLRGVFEKNNSIARSMLYSQMTPQLPPCLERTVSKSVVNNRPLLRILFQGNSATVPFISQTSRELHIDINILLANIDRVDGITCGVLVVELSADTTLQTAFVQRCQQANLTVEHLGYVTDDGI